MNIQTKRSNVGKELTGTSSVKIEGVLAMDGSGFHQMCEFCGGEHRIIGDEEDEMPVFGDADGRSFCDARFEMRYMAINNESRATLNGKLILTIGLIIMSADYLGDLMIDE